MTQLQAQPTTSPSGAASPGRSLPTHMRAARYHKVGEPFSIDTVERPSPRPADVVVQVEACGMVPNLRVVLNPPPGVIHTPQLPAIYGLDAAGVVAETGSLVHGVEPGDRVYVNPLRYCGACRRCRMGRIRACDYLALSAYLGSGDKSPAMLSDYPYGGYAEFMTAPQHSLVKLPDNVSFAPAARFGYLGTGYSAVRRANVNMSTTVLINGISGTLGLGATIFALALGAPLILGVGRDVERLHHVKSLSPERIHVLSTREGRAIDEWAGSLTDGEGVDVVIDALPTGASPASFSAAASALGRGGTHVNIGGVLEDVPINPIYTMNRDQTYTTSFWFTTCEGQEMADLAGSGLVNLDVLKHEIFALDDINEALAAVTAEGRDGGFTNFVVRPNTRNARGIS